MMSNWWSRFFASSGSRVIQRKQRQGDVRLRLEALEERALLSAAPTFNAVTGALVLRGDDAANTAHVAISNGFVELDIDGRLYSSDAHSANYSANLAGVGADSLKRIVFAGGRGVDTLIVGDHDLAGGLSVRGAEIVQIEGQVKAAGTIAVSATRSITVTAGGELWSLNGADGGAIRLTARLIDMGGRLSTDGVHGGSIVLNAKNVLDYGTMTADGTNGGGSILVHFRQHYLETTAAHTSADGGSGAGGTIRIAGLPKSSIYASGTTSATGQTGGHVDFLAGTVRLMGAQVDASGQAGGGHIRVGGDYQGKNADVLNARTTFIGIDTTLRADALDDGPGGRVIVWSDKTTEFYGHISARGGPNGGNGGFIEVSGKGDLNFAGLADAGADLGDAGTLLLDPKNITISSANGWVNQFNLVDPAPDSTNTFGQFIVPLSTGNVVVTNRNDQVGGGSAGAVYLFNGATGALISTLIGSTNDQVGNNGVTALSNGNFVVRSVGWNGGRGAATWGNGSTGISGTVSAANSLVGSIAGDSVGDSGITALTNGNYVVFSSGWDNGGTVDARAVTWGNGSTGTSGAVSAANSLVGSNSINSIGSGGIIALNNGNYVVNSPSWDNGPTSNVGAVTWGNGSSGVSGAVSAANSLVGSVAGDNIGSQGVTALTNGNYVVLSPGWDNGANQNTGAATWCDGSTGSTGAVAAANSLIGPGSFTDFGSSGGVTALSNGNYVVRSPFLSVGFSQNGAVSWGNGATGTTGTVAAGNSLIGAANSDSVGSGGVIALSNGNYVVLSPLWNNGATADAGAATWGNGATGTTGTVAAGNSLVGSTTNDQVGSGGVTALSNGNYVVLSPVWDNGATVDAGAATWGNGATGTTGAVAAGNSLVGSTTNDNVGSGGVTALSNGNYVVRSPFFGAGDVGAATWGDGSVGTSGAVAAGNSLVGSTANDQVSSSGVTALTNGNYVVVSAFWDNGAAGDAGAATWGNGATGTTGAVAAGNSLVGSTSSDQVGSAGVTALSNGNYVVRSPNWDNGATADAGAVTWGNGATGISGTVAAGNSLVGSTTNDNIGSGGTTLLSGGNYAVRSPNWDGPLGSNAGAATFGSGATGVSGAVSAANSFVGQQSNANLSAIVADTVNGAFVACFLDEINPFGSGRGRISVGGPIPASFSYSDVPGGSFTIDPAFLTQTLNTGTSLVLQANNDITVSSAITVNNAGGAGGNLTFQAGRSIILNADITTDDGNLTLIANDLLANGVVDAQRDPGAAVITTTGRTINAGTGTVTMNLRSGAGKTNSASGAVNLGTITAATVSVTNAGPSAGSDIVTNNNITTTGNLALTAAGLINQAAGNLLITGTSTLSAGSTITVNSAGNNFTGDVSVTAATNVNVRDTNALTLGAMTLSGTLTVTAGGALTQSAALSLSSTSSFTGSSITLTTAANSFGGAVSLSSGGNVSLAGGAIDLGTVNVTGTLGVTATGGSPTAPTSSSRAPPRSMPGPMPSP